MADFKSEGIQKLLMDLSEALGAKERDAAYKDVADKFDKDLTNESRRTSKVAGDNFTMKGKPKTVSSAKPNFTMPKGGDLVLRGSTEAVDVTPKTSKELVRSIADTIDDVDYSKVADKADNLSKLKSSLSKAGPMLGRVAKPALGVAGLLLQDDVNPTNPIEEDMIAAADQRLKQKEIDKMYASYDPVKELIAMPEEEEIGMSKDPSLLVADAEENSRQPAVVSEEEEVQEDPRIAELKSTIEKLRSSKQDTKGDGLLDRLKALQGEFAEKEKEARKRDLIASAIKGAANVLGTAAQGRFQSAAGQQIGYKPVSLDVGTDEALKALQQNRKEQVAALEQEIKNAASQELTPYQQAMLEERKRYVDEMARRQEKSFNEKDIDRKIKAEDRVYKVIADYEKHPVVKELDKQGLSFEQADGLIAEMEAGNQIALGALGTKMARAMGEVGVLTDQDVKRYIQAQSLVQKAQDMYGRNFAGRLSKETIKDIKEVNAKMKAGFLKRRKDLYDRYVKRAYENYGKQAGLELSDIETRFAMPSMQKSTKQEDSAKSESPYGDEVEKNGKVYKWNSTVGKYQLKR